VSIMQDENIGLGWVLTVDLSFRMVIFCSYGEKIIHISIAELVLVPLWEM